MQQLEVLRKAPQLPVLARSMYCRPARRLLPLVLNWSASRASPPRLQSLPSSSSSYRAVLVERRGTPFSIRHFHRVVPSRLPIPSPERLIFEDLQNFKHDKWGFVIYRCTYKDDQGWEHFKQLIHKRTQNLIKCSDYPETFDSLEWTYVEDRQALDGATRSQLRERFNQWAEEAVVTEQPRAPSEDHEVNLGAPRYNYFIQVDEEALQSVLAAPEHDLRGEGFVNFVDSRWKPLTEWCNTCVEDDEDDVLEPIDGCTEENVGWMRIASHLIGAEFYMMDQDAWYVYYLRPPEVLMH